MVLDLWTVDKMLRVRSNAFLGSSRPALSSNPRRLIDGDSAQKEGSMELLLVAVVHAR